MLTSVANEQNSPAQGHQNTWPGLPFVPKQLHLGLFFWQTAQEQSATERSQINANRNLLLHQYVLPTMHRSVFHSGAKPRYASDWLDIDLKASTDTTLSILQRCRAAHTQMGAIFFSCQVWQKGFMLPPRDFPLKRQNCTLVTRFFIKNFPTVALKTQSHLQQSWVIYRKCESIFGVFSSFNVNI